MEAKTLTFPQGDLWMGDLWMGDLWMGDLWMGDTLKGYPSLQLEIFIKIFLYILMSKNFILLDYFRLYL
jgi:hypothetical protein